MLLANAIDVINDEKSIKNISFGGNSIVRASIDLEILPHGIILKDCLLKEGQYGWFLSSPSKKLKEPYTNKDGKTQFLTKRGGSFVKFVNRSAFRDVSDFIVDSAIDVAGDVGSLAVDTATAVKSSIADLVKPLSFNPNVNIPKPITVKFNFDKYGPKIPKFGGPILDVNLPKLKAPTIDLPSLSFLSNFLPDLPAGSNKFQLG